MIKKIEEMTLEEINKLKFLEKSELKELSFSELCVYMENLNKIDQRYQELIKNKGE